MICADLGACDARAVGAEHEENWAYYDRQVDGALALFVVRLDHEDRAPVNGLGVSYCVTFELAQPGEQGLGEVEEEDRPGAVEEAVFARCSARGFAPVGHVRHAGEWRLYVYGPPDAASALREISPNGSAAASMMAGKRPSRRMRRKLDEIGCVVVDCVHITPASGGLRLR